MKVKFFYLLTKFNVYAKETFFNGSTSNTAI